MYEKKAVTLRRKWGIIEKSQYETKLFAIPTYRAE